MINDGMHYPFDLEVKKRKEKNLLLPEGCAVERQQTVPGAHTTQVPSLFSTVCMWIRGAIL